jgi:hypothetical protein
MCWRTIIWSRAIEQKKTRWFRNRSSLVSSHPRLPRGSLKEFVDQSLVWFVAFRGQTPELGEKPGRNANRDKLFRVSGFRAANPARAS